MILRPHGLVAHGVGKGNFATYAEFVRSKCCIFIGFVRAHIDRQDGCMHLQRRHLHAVCQNMHTYVHSSHATYCVKANTKPAHSRLHFSPSLSVSLSLYINTHMYLHVHMDLHPYMYSFMHMYYANIYSLVYIHTYIHIHTPISKISRA